MKTAKAPRPSNKIDSLIAEFNELASLSRQRQKHTGHEERKPKKADLSQELIARP